MTEYTYRLSAKGYCPVDGAADTYEIEITSGSPIFVEDILKAVSGAFAQPITQENATLALRHALPGAVRTKGTHSGVAVEVFAP